MLKDIYDNIIQILSELQEVSHLTADSLLVIGASSSEIAGEKIGTAGSLDIADELVDAVLHVQKQYGFSVAFQCCEHLNRALVVSIATQLQYGLEEVSVVPIQHAGGSLATVAYKRLLQPVVVESVKAHAGIDIGDTLIGMHLRPVAVPVRPSILQIGQAHVTMARTRPKLIGGSRAVYQQETDQTCSMN